MMKERQLEQDPEAWMKGVLETFGCQTGTLHRADGDCLDLVVAVGVPEKLLPVIARIPFGKGIAGAAAASREPVELCNLQEDLGGVAKEGARQTNVSGSLAVPIFSPDGSLVVGTLGVGKYVPYDFSDDEKERLADVAQGVSLEWE